MEAEERLEYSEENLKEAAEFRAEIHSEALKRLQKIDPGIRTVVDRHPAEAYLRQHWDYPGKWYPIAAIPQGFRSREALVDALVQDTLSSAAEVKETPELPLPEPAERVELPLPEARPFSVLYADYPDAAADVYIVKDDRPCRGLASHRRALAAACRALSAPDGDGAAWRFDVCRARGWPVSADAPFVCLPPNGGLNFRRAILDPPQGNLYDSAGFDALCAALFPGGRSRLEVFEWSTDWSDYFDEGHEWWGALCCTVYDRSLDRYAVIMASATD